MDKGKKDKETHNDVQVLLQTWCKVMNGERIWLWLPKMEHVYDWWFNIESIFNNDFIIQHCL